MWSNRPNTVRDVNLFVTLICLALFWENGGHKFKSHMDLSHQAFWVGCVLWWDAFPWKSFTRFTKKLFQAHTQTSWNTGLYYCFAKHRLTKNDKARNSFACNSSQICISLLGCKTRLTQERKTWICYSRKKCECALFLLGTTKWPSEVCTTEGKKRTPISVSPNLTSNYEPEWASGQPQNDERPNKFQRKGKELRNTKQSAAFLVQPVILANNSRQS